MLQRWKLASKRCSLHRLWIFRCSLPWRILTKVWRALHALDCSPEWQYLHCETALSLSTCQGLPRCCLVSSGLIRQVHRVSGHSYYEGKRVDKFFWTVLESEKWDLVWSRKTSALYHRYRPWEQVDVFVWVARTQAQTRWWLHGPWVLARTGAMGAVWRLCLPNKRAHYSQMPWWPRNREGNVQAIPKACKQLGRPGLRWPL